MCCEYRRKKTTYPAAGGNSNRIYAKKWIKQDKAGEF